MSYTWPTAMRMCLCFFFHFIFNETTFSIPHRLLIRSIWNVVIPCRSHVSTQVMLLFRGENKKTIWYWQRACHCCLEWSIYESHSLPYCIYFCLSSLFILFYHRSTFSRWSTLMNWVLLQWTLNSSCTRRFLFPFEMEFNALASQLKIHWVESS